MRLLPLLAAPLLSALLGCPGVRWEETLDGAAHGALSGVWGTGPDDVWIVGGTFEQAEILHFDGDAWSDSPAPAIPLLSWAYGWGPDDVLAVGVGGGVARWSGSTWSELDSGTDTDLWGVFGFSSDDVWIVGGTVGETEPLLLHFDGQDFTPHSLPADQNPRNASAVFKVWGIDGTLFAVGETGLMLQWEGAAWISLAAGAQANQDFVSLWGTSADHMVAVGGRGNARVATWDGSAWDTVAPSAIGGLNAVAMVDEDEAIIGGVSGFVGTFTPSTGEVAFEDTLPGGDVHATWNDGAGRTYAVGGRFYEPMTGLAWVRTGG